MELNNNAATAYKVSEPQLGAIYMRSKMDNVNEEKNQRLHDVPKDLVIRQSSLVRRRRAAGAALCVFFKLRVLCRLRILNV